MSFSGRLSGGGSSNDHQGDNSVVPISMSSNFEDDRLSLPIHNQVLISRTIQDGQKEILVDDLIGKEIFHKNFFIEIFISGSSILYIKHEFVFLCPVIPPITPKLLNQS